MYNEMMQEVLKKWGIVSVVVIITVGYVYIAAKGSVFRFSQAPKEELVEEQKNVNKEVVARFKYLSKNGNSACSSAFKDSILSMQDDARLRGSCCSPMSLHRYSEQIEGLKKYNDISIIPPDPYDVEASLAKKLITYYDIKLTAKEQKAYDFAMQNSEEKGPCCCKCWRWYVYGGLGKHLIQKYNFTGEQITDIWNLSDGCGGEGDHVKHS